MNPSDFRFKVHLLLIFVGFVLFLNHSYLLEHTCPLNRQMCWQCLAFLFWGYSSLFFVDSGDRVPWGFWPCGRQGWTGSHSFLHCPASAAGLSGRRGLGAPFRSCPVPPQPPPLYSWKPGALSPGLHPLPCQFGILVCHLDSRISGLQA